MATNFPTNLDTSITLPAEPAGTILATNHVVAHQNLQDSMEAVQAKIGIDSSAVTTSHDYKLSEVTDLAVGKTATQTLTNKTLTSPTLNTPTITSPVLTVGSDATGDIYYRGAGGFTRLAKGTDTQILKLASGLPTWDDEITTVDADATTKGIVEIATAAEITAGTATGGTGAVIAISPDQLALSTPVFNGSGLTNIITSESGTDTSGAINSTGNTDVVVTTTFQPKTIKLRFTANMQGTGGIYQINPAVYDGTTSKYWTGMNDQDGTVSPTDMVYVTGAPTMSAAGGTNQWACTVTILAVSSTSFTVRFAATKIESPTDLTIPFGWEITK